MSSRKSRIFEELDDFGDLTEPGSSTPQRLAHYASILF
jgi:hypothetical protein